MPANCIQGKSPNSLSVPEWESLMPLLETRNFDAGELSIRRVAENRRRGRARTGNRTDWNLRAKGGLGS